MPGQLADYLKTVQQQLFVGRGDEKALFREAITAEEMPFHVLYVWGPGGVGKTALTLMFREISRACGVPFFRLDARDLEPTAGAFIDALEQTLGQGRTRRSLSDVAVQTKRLVLVIDTYEMLEPLDRWICEDFLPTVPDNVFLVLSGRNQRSAEWRAHLGLQALVRPLPLRNLGPEESRQFLSRRQVPEAQHAAILAFAQGHPLALSLVADVYDQQPDLQFDPDQTPDIVGTLLNRFLVTTLTPQQRVAVELSALVRHTTQPLLATVLTDTDSHTLFEWLRGRSFMEADAHGIYPHDLVREVLAADLRWRDPGQYQHLSRQARRYYTDQLIEGADRPYEQILADYLFLSRDNPVIRPFFLQLREQWQGQRPLSHDHRHAEDVPVLREALARYEGDASAALFEAWVERLPEGLHVVRDAGGRPVGCLFTVTLTPDMPAGQTVPQDPALAAARAYLEAHAPLRTGERALLFRFWFSEADYQDVSPVQSLIFIQTVRYYLETEGLAFTFLPCADPDFWQLVLNYADLHRLPEADFSVGGSTHGMFGHDWRVCPPARWLDLLAERGSAFQARSVAPERRSDLLVLSESDFAEAVKEALQSFTRLDRLQDNPLMRSRVVLDQIEEGADEADRARTLRQLLLQVAEPLKASPREAKFYRALQATYFDPAPTQERAAEALDLPFSTYRRHLRSGIEAVIQALWQREIRG
ncbi:hypothetical protein AWN76_017180 [Rhodothermaceae bacterium RA]|nr:hypothetical protein AWN76_017180 [Rhodothermaceae bacterium RA]